MGLLGTYNHFFNISLHHTFINFLIYLINPIISFVYQETFLYIHFHKPHKNIMINFENINLSYNGKEVITNLSLTIKQGEKVVVTGKSGSGKSSLLAMILGFAEPNKGEITFDGTLIDDKTIWDIRKKIAYVDQDVNLGAGKLPALLDTISKLKINSHLNFSKQKLNELLEYFEFNGDIINKNVEELSGGERQRLAIIIAILLERKIFLLDEITSALDKHLKKIVAEYFIDKKDSTCLIVSHDYVWIDNPSVKVFDLETKTWKQ